VTLTESILEAHRVARGVGAYDWYRPDLVLLPDYALALLAEVLEDPDRRLDDPGRVLVAADHFAPPAEIERAAILGRVTALCRRHGLELRLFEGIAHQLAAEDPRVAPGALVIGADSHTVTAGALGCLAVGFGSTDVLTALLHGRVAARRPECIRVALHGACPEHVMGKDIMLRVLELLGPERINYRSLELLDRTRHGIPQDDRFAMCNMVAEGGGKACLFLPDRVTAEYLRARARRGKDGERAVKAPDRGVWQAAVQERSAYVEQIELDVSRLEPLVALPGDPFAVAPLREVAGEPLDQVFLGSCNAGRLRDLEVAARLLEGRRVARDLRCIVIPASRSVYLAALERGYIATLLRAGVVVGAPSCGPCGGIDKGVLGPGEVCAATINRNYPGRMGSVDARIFLVSPAVAAASMVTGRLTDPRELG
jgi:3-isopropylmalate/(R)-2-methylmalate dehydratase large subunit